MKIFVVPSAYPWEKNKTAGIFTYEQCVALKKAGFEIIIIDSSGVNYKEWLHDSCSHIQITNEATGIRYTLHTRIFKSSKFPIVSTFLCRIKTRKIFKRAVNEQGIPDLLLAHFSLSGGFACADISKKYHIPFDVVEHYSLYYDDTISFGLRLLLQNEIKKCNHFICVSNHLKESLEKHIVVYKKIEVIPNMISSIFQYQELKPSENFRFFSAGNLTVNKRFDLLIQSFSNAFKATDKVELIIAGDGPEKQNLKSIIQETGLSNRIKLLGSIRKEEMVQQYTMCNCFVLLSKKETFGIVYREALAVGRPIIATRNGGVEESWDDSFGLLLDDDSIASVSRALKEMVASYKIYDFKRISNICNELYSEKVVVEKYKSLFTR